MALKPKPEDSALDGSTGSGVRLLRPQSQTTPSTMINWGSQLSEQYYGSLSTTILQYTPTPFTPFQMILRLLIYYYITVYLSHLFDLFRPLHHTLSRSLHNLKDEEMDARREKTIAYYRGLNNYAVPFWGFLIIVIV